MDALDPDLKIPARLETGSASSASCRGGAWGLFGEVTYVGNRGDHLLRQPDINQASFEDLTTTRRSGQRSRCR